MNRPWNDSDPSGAFQGLGLTRCWEIPRDETVPPQSLPVGEATVRRSGDTQLYRCGESRGQRLVIGNRSLAGTYPLSSRTEGHALVCDTTPPGAWDEELRVSWRQGGTK